MEVSDGCDGSKAQLSAPRKLGYVAKGLSFALINRLHVIGCVDFVLFPAHPRVVIAWVLLAEVKFELDCRQILKNDSLELNK